MISLSIQTLTLERYITFAKRFMTFTHAQFMQMMGLAVILFVICLMYQTQQNGWKGLLVRLPKELLISLWTAFIVGLTLINRIEGTSDDMIFNPLTTLRVALHGDIFEQFQTLSNVALFMPYGFLLPMNFQHCKKVGWCAVICAGSSLMIEVSQHVTRRGTFDTSDLILNC